VVGGDRKQCLVSAIEVFAQFRQPLEPKVRLGLGRRGSDSVVGANKLGPDAWEGDERGTGVHPLPVDDDPATLTAHPVVPFDDGDVVPCLGEQRGGREPADSRTEDEDSCHVSPRARK